jgi:hypothetical protein
MAKFEKGNKIGNRFSKDKQPEENGRKPKIRALDILLAEVVGDEGMSKVIAALQKAAEKGNVYAAQCLLDRQYGKAKQPIELEGKVELTPSIIVKQPDEPAN